MMGTVLVRQGLPLLQHARLSYRLNNWRKMHAEISRSRDMMTKRLLTVAVSVVALVVPAALAQQQQSKTERISGTIEQTEGNTIHAKDPGGRAITVKLAEKAAITAV